MGKFQELKVWQHAKDLAVFIYKLTGKGIFANDYGLKEQMNIPIALRIKLRYYL